MEQNKREREKQEVQKRLLLIGALYTFILTLGNFVGDRQLSLLYFTVSLGTLLFQIVCCALISFSETLKMRRCIQLIWVSAAINLAVALFIFFILDYPIPNFWYDQNGEVNLYRQIQVVVAFSLFYAICGTIVIFAARLIRLWVGRGWLLARVALVVITALIVDMLLLSPLILYLGNDTYTSGWKILSLFSVKISLSLLSIPVCYFLVGCFKDLKLRMGR